MAISGRAQRCDQSDRVVKEIKGLVEAPEPSLGVSWVEKRLQRLGDGAALAIVQGYTNDELQEGGRLRRVLAIFRTAFSHPNRIESPINRRPRVTGLLLRDLYARTSDKVLKEEIKDLLTYLAEKPMHD